MARSSQVPPARTVSSTSQPASRRERSSLPPLRLLPPPDVGGALPFAAARGAAPGVYFPGKPVLAKGARVGVLCDSLYGDPEVGIDYASGIAAAAELIASLGFTPVVDEVQANVAPYFDRWAGSPQVRAEHFVRLLETHAVDAVFPLFGKGGDHAVVDAIAASGYRPRRPVALIGGFSHQSDWSLFGQSDFGRAFFSHLISATQCAYWKLLPAANIENLHSVLHRAEAVQYTGLFPLNEVCSGVGTLTGTLAGGNLSAFLRNAHKPWFPNLKGKLVVCEDFDNAPHEVHYRASQFVRLLARAGACAGIVSAMLPIKRPTHAKLDPTRRRAQADRDQAELAAIWREATSKSQIPVFQHAGICGHGAMNYPLGFGGQARLTVTLDGEISLYNCIEVV